MPCPPPRLRPLVLLLVTAALLSACDRPAGLEPYQPQFSAFLQARGAPAVRDLPALQFDLPPAERPWEVSPDRLIVEIEAGQGRAFLILKDSVNVPSRQAQASAVDRMSSGRVVRRGLRGALDKASVDRALASIERAGAEVIRFYEWLGVVDVSLSRASATALLTNPWIDQIEPLPRKVDQLDYLRSAGAESIGMFAQSTPWGIQTVGAPLAWSIGATGSGVRLLVVDQGHFQGHEDLAFVPNANCFGAYGGCDDHPVISHGTHVLGIATARNNGIGVVGMAPALTGTNTFVWGGCQEPPGLDGCPHAEQLAALNWAVGNLGPNGVVNMSLGGPEFNLPVSLATASANAVGIVIVASAGNHGTNAVRYPAGYSNVIGVSGMLSSKAFPLNDNAPCSNTFDADPGSGYGPHVDLAAPWDAVSTVGNNQYAGPAPLPAVQWCGTSMAAPHVAGAVALIRSISPNLDPSNVFTRLTSTAEDLGPAGWDLQFGAGMVRAHLAAGLLPPAMTASVVNSKPKLTWTAVPFATEYRINRRVTPFLAPTWVLWATRTGTTYTDTSTPVSSFYGYNTYPSPDVGVSYYVTAYASGSEAGFGNFATFVPIGTPPY